MTRAEIEAAAKSARAEVPLLALAVGLLLDIRDELKLARDTREFTKAQRAKGAKR